MAKTFSGAPQFVKYFGPVLDALHQLGGSGRPDEVRSVIAQKLGLSEQEQSEPLPSKAQPRFDNQVHWAEDAPGVVSGERAGIPPRTAADQPVTPVGEGARSDQRAGRIRDTQSPAGRSDRGRGDGLRDRDSGSAGGRAGEHGRSVTEAPTAKREDGDLPQTADPRRSPAKGAERKEPADLNHSLPKDQDFIPSGDKTKVRANLDALFSLN